MRRLIICCAAPVLGLWVATHIFAWQHVVHPAWRPLPGLGLYPPWDILRWWAGFGWVAGWGMVKAAVLIGAGVTGLGLAGCLERRPRMPQGARWASRRDLARAGLFAPSGVVLGRYGRRIVRWAGTQHTLCVGPTRSGKGVGHVIPTLLDWPDSVIIHDPKWELYPITASWRETFSTVIHVCPTDAHSARFNPIDGIRWYTDLEQRDIQTMAAILANPDGEKIQAGSAADHFYRLSCELLSGLIPYGKYSGVARDLGTLNVMFSTTPWDDMLTCLQSCAHPAVQRCAGVMSKIVDRELGSVLSSTSTALQLWTDPLIDRATSVSDFSLRDVREGPRPMSLYLTIPWADQARLRPLTRLLIRQVLDHATETLHGHAYRLLGVMDEVAALRYFPAVEEGLDYLAGYGVHIMSITPSLNSLARYYGDRNNFWEGSTVRLIYAPNSATMAGFFARETGEAVVTKSRRSWREGWPFFRPGTVSQEPTLEPLLSTTQLQQLPEDECLLLVGNLPPARLQKIRYYEDPYYRRRVQ